MMPVLHNYHGFSSRSYYDALRTSRNQNHDQSFFTTQPFYRSFYPIQSHYQAIFHRTSEYPTNVFNQYAGFRTNSTAMTGSGQSDRHYRFQHAWPYVNQTQQRHSDLSLLAYAGTLPTNYQPNTISHYDTGIQTSFFPVIENSSYFHSGSSRNLGYRSLSGLRYPIWTRTTYPNAPHVAQLPPKIRVIFVPPSGPSVQQGCAGPLTMPPFLFNCMTQPLCSLPLPPPLPQISSLPLTFSLQQKIMEQYANPVAVLPFTSNWPSCPSFTPNYPSTVQFQPPATSPQAWLLSDYTPQPYVPPVALPYSLPIPSFYPTSVLSERQPSTGDHTSAYHASVTAQPSSHIPAGGYSCVQQDFARHHVPMAVSNSNARVARGRMRSPSRYSTVEHNAPKPSIRQRRSFRTNADHSRNNRSFKLPPLPPGAVIISDEYIEQPAPSGYYVGPKNRYSSGHQGTGKSAQYSRSDVSYWNASRKRRSSGKRSQNSDSRVNISRSTRDSTSANSSDYSSTSCSCTATDCDSCYSSTCRSCTPSSSSSYNSLVGELINLPPTITNSHRRKRKFTYQRSSHGARAFRPHDSYVPHSSLPVYMSVPAGKSHIEPLPVNYDTEEKNDIVSSTPKSNEREETKTTAGTSSFHSVRNPADEARDCVNNEQERDSFSLTSISTLNSQT